MIEAPIRLLMADFVAALSLPAAATMNQRVSKKMLSENCAPTTADRKLLQDCTEEISWVAALKPANIGIAEYRSDRRSYLELPVICITLRRIDSKSVKIVRIAELVHRAIPYPTVLVLDDGTNLFVSLTHIRWAHKEAGKTVLDGDLIQGFFPPTVAASGADEALTCFLNSLALDSQPRVNLYSLYQGWIDALMAWQTFAVTGRFEISNTREKAVSRRTALKRYCELDEQIASLRSAAIKEHQMARQVAANVEIQALLTERHQTSLEL